MKPSAKLLLLPVVSLLFGVAASSHAKEAFFSSPSRTLEQLWSGILECHDPAENAGFLPRSRFDSDGTTFDATAVLDGTERRDYAACARRSLRDDSSRMLVETVERAMRHGGVALLGERFRLDSSISWVQGESVRGELDAVVPVWGGERPEGTGSALFLQHGLVVWEGLADGERIDANFGLAYRSHLGADTVAGGSLFYDYDFKRGHKRIGAGADIRSGIFRAAVNYYHPLGGWRGGREGYEERALQGADLRFGFIRDRFSLDGRAGAWRFEGEENAKSEWRASYGVAGGYRILPGVFAELGYEHHDSKESLGSRWNAGLAFRFDLPGLEGSDSAQEGYGAPDLWRPVEREKRILYEERLVLSRVRLRAEDARIAEGGTGVVSGTLTSALAGEAELHLMVHSSSTATHGAGSDFTLAHMISAADARSVSGRSPGDGAGAVLESEAFDCSELPCAMMLPAGATEFEILVNALEDLEREHDEHVDLHIDIPGPYTHLVRSRDIVRMTIGAHENTIAFAQTQSRMEEFNAQTREAGTANIEVGVNLPAARPVTLNIETGGSATRGEDYTLTPSVLTIPAGQGTGTITLTGINDALGEGDETVVLSLSAADPLPPGWTLDGTRTHTLTLADAPPRGVIGFAADLPLSATEGGSVELDVVSSVPAEGEGSLWMVWEVAPGEEVVEPAGTVSIASGEDRGNFTVNIRDDADVENIEEITILLSGSSLQDGWSISGRNTHTLHIHASDNTVGFDAASERKLSEGAVHEGATHAVVTLVLTNPLPEAGAVSLLSDNPDIRITPAKDTSAVYEGTTLTIPSGITRLPLVVSSEHDVDGEHENATLTLGDSGLPGGWAVASEASAHDLDIEDDDVPGPTVSFDPDGQASDSAVQEGMSASITLRASEALPAEAKVAVALSGIADADVSGYILSATTPASVAGNVVTIPAGATMVALSLAVPEDDNVTRENVVLTLSADTLPEDWEIGEPRRWQIAVGENDTAVAGFTSATTTDTEAGGEAILAVELSHPAPQGGLNLNLRAEPSTGLSLALNDASQATYVSSSAAGGSLAIAEGQTRAEFIVSHPGENDSLNNRFTVTLEAGEGFPGEWLVDSGRNTNLVVFNDATPLPNTIGWETSAIEIAEGGAAVTASLKLTDVANGGIAPARIPSIAMEVTHNDQADFTPFVAGGIWSARYDLVILDSKNNFPADGLVPVTLTPVDDTLREGTETFTFRLTPVKTGFPDGWEIDTDSDTLTLTVADNEIALPGVSVIEFVGTGASVNEEGAQSATATVHINHPNPDAMKVSLRFPAEGANPASPAQDYTFDISDNVSRDSGNVITIPGGTESFGITVTAADDAEDDDLETVTLLLEEDPGSPLPEGWGVGPSSRYTVTILDNDEGAVPVASLSQWPRDGAQRGSFAQLSSTTPEGGTASAAVYLTQPAPDDGGLNFILSVPEEYADDVTLANREDERSSLRALSGAGRYAFNMKKAYIRGAPNLAALFDINVVDDAINEHPESFDITISMGGDFPGGWVLRDEIVYRLTIPVDPADTDDYAVSWEKPSSVVEEDHLLARDGTAIKLLVDGPLEDAAKIGMELTGYVGGIAFTSVTGGSYDADEKMLTINPGEKEVVFEVVSTGDVTGHTAVGILIWELSGADVLPEGWSIGRNAHDVTIEDNERTVTLDAPSNWVREGERISAKLRISPPLITRDFLFPLRIEGDVSSINLYKDSETTPLSLSYDGTDDYSYPDDMYGHMARVQSDRSVSADTITLTFEAKQDSNAVREHIEIYFSDDNDHYGDGQRFELQHFAPHFTILNDRWSVDILDDEARSVSFIQERVEVNERERTTTSLQLSGPPLEEGQTLAVPILVHGDRDAWDIISVTPSDVRFEDYTVHFDRDNTFATFEIQARQDADYDNDTVTFSVDRKQLPEGLYVGSHGSSAIFMRDNRLPSVFLTVQQVVPVSETIVYYGEYPVNRDVFGNLYYTPEAYETVSMFLRIEPPETPIRLSVGGQYVTDCCGDLDYGDTGHPTVDLRMSSDGTPLENIEVYRNDRSTRWNIKYIFKNPPGNHSLWIHSVPDGTVIGDSHRVNFITEE